MLVRREERIGVVIDILNLSAGYKQIKCLLLTYTVFMLLLFAVTVVGGVLAYIFREQVKNTIRAEMIADLRNYDPETESSVTRAWDETQSQLECCGFMTEQVRVVSPLSLSLTSPLSSLQVTESWRMWSYNKFLNPGSDSLLVPASCCLPNLECRQDNITIVENIWPGDCMTLSLQYVRQHAAILGIANVTVCFFLVRQFWTIYHIYENIYDFQLFGLLAGLSLFRSIV